VSALSLHMAVLGRFLLAVVVLASAATPGGVGGGAHSLAASAAAGNFGPTLLSEGNNRADVEDLDSWLADRIASSLEKSTPFLEVSYNDALQPMVDVNVGGQWLKLVFDASSGNTIVFVEEFKACEPSGFEPCYSYKEAEANHTLKVCEENNNMEIECNTQASSHYDCSSLLKSLADAKPHPDALIIDGLEYDQKSVEGVEDMTIRLVSGSHQEEQRRNVSWSGMPVRLLVEAMKIPSRPPWLSLDLFAGASGVLGASGPSLSCRKDTLWTALLKKENVTRFIMDFAPPPSAVVQDKGARSRVVLNEIDLSRSLQDVIWSQPKQTGDLINDGMHEFLMYRLEVCGVNLLYNTSSNWLVVIDTSGPCLSLPPFLFDRLMSRIPAECPFGIGERAQGRLCSPRRETPHDKLPSLFFQLEDAGEPEPPRLWIPLERLVFKNASGQELLCVSRDDSDPRRATADMMYSHIAFGSMAVSTLYTVVDLENHTVGLASKGDLAREASNSTCTPSRTCKGSQTYYPPQNVCEDPLCSAYMLMSLDDEAKTCKWSRAVPFCFGALLVVLAALDLLSHRLYKQAIEKASELNQ